ncbi:MAG: Gfo/Idh/MocA family oxidoreductase [Kiritimatiellae bacterium]|nr:Gfo/Idh/MocA family oxidoreductase [Kiritimatiellia bacterium]
MAEKKIYKIGMIGGGMKSFMGNIHRQAIENVGNLKIVGGSFGTSKQASYDFIKPLGLNVDDLFPSYRDFLRREKAQKGDKKLLFVSAVLPNTMHYPIAMTAMDCGVPILGEKPFTSNIDEAANLVRKQKATKVPYRIAMVYPAYSQLVHARNLLAKGEIGIIRRFVITMQSGWMARRVENQGNTQALWRVDGKRNGVGGVLNDCGCHCQFVLEWLTGFEISEVCVGAHACVPGRLIPDDATVLVRTKQGIGGTFMMSQIATGHNDGLTVEITGDKGALIWKQCNPGVLTVVGNDGKRKEYMDSTASGESDFAETPYGANAAYVEALTRVYEDFIDSLTGKTKKSRSKDHRILGMTAEEGMRSVAVTTAMEKSIQFVPPDAPPAVKWQPVVLPQLEFPRMTELTKSWFGK